jgi:hypothetical protein
MKNRSIILTAILSLLVCGGLSGTALADNPTRDDNPARSAVQQVVQVTPPLGSLTGQSSITIPATEIFVLETVSVFALDVITNSTVQNIEITVTENLITGWPNTTGTATYELAIPPAIPPGLFVNSQALHLYAQPGSTLTVTFTVTPPANGGILGKQSLTVSLSGYFVNAQ